MDDIWNWLNFSQKIRAKELLLKHFILNIDYIIHNNTDQTKIGRGGHNREGIFLNVRCFKLMCIKAETKKAKEIHEYFLKLEELLYQVINEESSELKLQLEQKNTEIETNKKEFNMKLQLEKQKLLLREFDTIGSIIYIIKVKSYDNGEYIVKIGQSNKGITSRFNEHTVKYEEILLLDCFMVKKSHEFENFLHNHESIKLNKVTNLINHENEKELFLIGKNLSYNMLLKIINSNIKQYNEINFELETLKNLIISLSEKNINNDIISELISNQNKTLLLIENLQKSNLQLEKTNKEILEKLNSQQIKTTNNFNEPLKTIGPRLQKINDETNQLVKVYETVTECLKENNKFKRPSIDKAVNENSIYHGYRWLYVDRDLDPNIIYNIEPTKKTRIQEVGYVCKLNKDKTEILNIYLDKKTACKFNEYPSPSSLDIHVKNYTLTKNNYYILYDKCPEELKNKFKIIPCLFKDGVGQYDSENKLIKEFVCKNACCKILGISDKSLNKALEKNIMYNNFYFKHLGEKLKCL